MEPPQEEEKKTFIEKLQQKLAELRFASVSLLLHVVIVFIAGTAVMYKHLADPPDFAPEGGSGLVSEETVAEPPPNDPQVEQQTFTATTPQVTAPSVDMIVSDSKAPSTFQMQASMPSIKAPATDMKDALTKVAATSMGSGLKGLPSTMAGRAGGTARTALMQKNKMADKSEKAVLSGLHWLKNHQSADGSWSKVNTPAMTGLAVLAFLGHGETPESPEFGPTVKKGIDWLLNKGTQSQGAFIGNGSKFAKLDVYEHAIGAYAMGEYYTMTKDERVKAVLTQAIAYIVNGQQPDGGWQYSYDKSGNKGSDTSVSGWQIQALKAAHLTGLALPGVDEALDKSMINLKRVQADDGSFGYLDNKGRYSLTGVGALCTIFWKSERDKVARDGIKYIIDKSDKDFPVEYKGAKADLYAWYYDTQACLMAGGEAWNKWNRWFQSEITDNQNSDGSWPPTGNKKPVGGVEADTKEVGPYYRTSVCVLMLEVYYRYTPTSK